MNAVEIEAAVSELAEEPFDPVEFAFEFLAAFGHKETALKRLRAGNSNTSDVPGGVLLAKNIHLAVALPERVSETLQRLRESPANVKGKPKMLLATDGLTLEAEDLDSGETIACNYPDFANHFGFFLTLAGITTVREIKDNPIDIRATSRLNKLYVELLSVNPEWGTPARQADMNHFMARMVFCFFAEDTNIFGRSGHFTNLVNKMSDPDGKNTHEILETVFRAMDIREIDRAKAEPRLPGWIDDNIRYVNGGLFSGNVSVPKFSRLARRYFLHAGVLNWREINPDIFGSMIQAVANADERSNLGMHYTSVPNILKLLNPLFLDDLRAQLAEAGDNERKLLNLRKRMARIRVFDPACGSGNFLVIAYKQMREIEAEVNRRRGELHLPSVIPLTNFRGIEINSFPAEIARLSLIITEFQCDVLYRGQQDAITEFLPLQKENWIVNENALHVDWEKLAPVEGSGVDVYVRGTQDMFEGRPENAELDFDNEGGEGYICGNPPYLGSTWQTDAQKADLAAVFGGRVKLYKSLDYVSGWFMKAADYCARFNAAAAFVSTNSICQGQQVPILWPAIFKTGCSIFFAYESFKWANLASHKAGVTVVIVGISFKHSKAPKLYSVAIDGEIVEKTCAHINAYLINGKDILVEKRSTPICDQSPMDFGNKPVDGGNLLLTANELHGMSLTKEHKDLLVRRVYGSSEFIKNSVRYALWITDENLSAARAIPAISNRIDCVKSMRLSSTDPGANEMAKRPHQFREMNSGAGHTIVVPAISSENRPYLPCGVVGTDAVVSNKCYALYDAPLWNMALIASRLHWLWIGTVCVRMRTDFSYSNTLGWNTFPVPTLTDQNKDDLTRCAEDILLAREAHYPATIADLYDPDAMPDNLRQAHERNDEVLERIYIGRRFKNDTERLEKLFDMYAKMTDKKGNAKPSKKTLETSL